MKLFKNAKGFISGVLVGAIVVATVPVLAAGEQITAMIDDSIKLIIAGEAKTLPSDYKVLNYGGYTYLPSRYVAEQLGSTVSWDEASRIITVSAPPVKTVEKIVEVPVEVEKPCPDTSNDSTDTKDNKSYASLPTASTKSKFRITINDISSFSGLGTLPYTSVIGEVDNLGDENIYIDYTQATLEAGGVTYKTSESPATLWDEKLVYGDVMSGDNLGATFVFPKVDPKQKNFTLKLTAKIQSTGQNIDFEINFKGDISED